MEVSNGAPWLSVVTVSLHEDKELLKTLESIDEQDTAGVERVLVMGSEPSSKLTARVTRMDGVIVVQKPEGIYMAMNAGLAAARGSLVHFLNAGDAYADSQVLATVHQRWRETGFTWAYGRMYVMDPVTGREHIRGVGLTRMERRKFRGLNFPELPTVFVRGSVLHDVGGFDSSYRIAADYRVMLEVATSHPGEDLDRVVTRYALGGVSDTEWRESLRECQRARREVLAPKGIRAGVEWCFGVSAVIAQELRRTPRSLARVARL